MAAENSAMCLVRAMDRLWFHQIILFSEPTPFLTLPDQNPKSNRSEQEIAVIKSKENETIILEERQSRSNGVVASSKSRFQSSSPMSNKKRKLQKTMSCKSLGELEIEEVKGFMDLGFVFKKENLSEHVTSLIPGLQRIDACNFEDKSEFTSSNDDSEDDYEEEEDENEEEQGIIRPYLSEAWNVKRPDYPLLNYLRVVPRGVSTTSADMMKKHLKFWARSVALAIQQQSSWSILLN